MKKNYPLYIACYAFINVVTFGLALVVAGCITRSHNQVPPLPPTPKVVARGMAVNEIPVPQPPLPESVTFELHFPTNVDLSYMFKIETSTNLTDWEFLDDTGPGDNYKTTNWEWTAGINYNEPHRYYRITPHKP